MKRRIALFAVLFLFVLLCGCEDNYDNSAYYSAMTANKDVSLSEPLLPMDVGGIYINSLAYADFDKLVSDSDLIAVGKVKSVYSARQDPFLYLGIPDADMRGYPLCYVTNYEITLSEVLKGGHSAGEDIIFTYYGNDTIKWTHYYGEPDAVMNVGSEYLLFLECGENSVTDEQHTFANKVFFTYMVTDGGLKFSDKRGEPLKDMTLSDVKERVSELTRDSEPEPTEGMKTESYYSDPQNYMCEQYDVGFFVDEFQLVNTADDILLGTITDIEDFDGEVCYYSAEKTRCEGQVLTIRVKDSLKGSHSAGDKIKLFARSDEKRDTYLSPYQKGLDCVFFLVCMDSVSPYHLSIGEFHAALLSDNGTIYNRANFSDEALTTGFIRPPDNFYYQILFSECFTYEQLADTIKGCMVELPGRITYGEFCLTQNE